MRSPGHLTIIIRTVVKFYIGWYLEWLLILDPNGEKNVKKTFGGNVKKTLAGNVKKTPPKKTWKKRSQSFF